jgi:hypothetical protein
MPNEDDLDISDDIGDIEMEMMDERLINAVRLDDLSAQELCDVVVAFRYLGVFRERAVQCMEELARRRTIGDTFDFEKYIEETVKNLPVIDLAIKAFR